jgi:hypothetical protein
MNASFVTQAPGIINVAKNAGAAFIVGAAGSAGVVVGIGVGGMILTNIVKKKLIGSYLDFKKGFK